MCRKALPPQEGRGVTPRRPGAGGCGGEGGGGGVLRVFGIGVGGKSSAYLLKFSWNLARGM